MRLMLRNNVNGISRILALLPVDATITYGKTYEDLPGLVELNVVHPTLPESPYVAGSVIERNGKITLIIGDLEFSE